MNVAVFIAGAIHGFLVPDLVMRLDTTTNNTSANIGQSQLLTFVAIFN